MLLRRVVGFVLWATFSLHSLKSVAQDIKFSDSTFHILGHDLPLYGGNLDSVYRLSHFKRMLGKQCRVVKTTPQGLDQVGSYLEVRYEKLGLILYTNEFHRKYSPDPWVLSIEFLFPQVGYPNANIHLFFLDNPITDHLNFDGVSNDPRWKPLIIHSSAEDLNYPDKGVIDLAWYGNRGGFMRFDQDDSNHSIQSFRVTLPK